MGIDLAKKGIPQKSLSNILKKTLGSATKNRGSWAIVHTHTFLPNVKKMGRQTIKIY